MIVSIVNDFVEVLDGTNYVSTIVRLLLALVLGGILGYERGKKRRPAGLRTYMIVCMASALVVITGEFLSLEYPNSDPTRMSAQVISGIGFLGAGTIIITSRQIKGLTTAAGLWASACIGIAVGAGYYVGAIAGGLLILATMVVMAKVDDLIKVKSKRISFFAEFKSMEALGSFIKYLRGRGHKIYDIEVNTRRETMSDLVGVNFYIGIANADIDRTELIEALGNLKGVRYLEELNMF